jgi:hypothetical protein
MTKRSAGRRASHSTARSVMPAASKVPAVKVSKASGRAGGRDTVSHSESQMLFTTAALGMPAALTGARKVCCAGEGKMAEV